MHLSKSFENGILFKVNVSEVYSETFDLNRSNYRATQPIDAAQISCINTTIEAA